MSRGRTLIGAGLIVFGIALGFAGPLVPVPARAQYVPACPPGYYYYPSYGCVPPGYFYGPPYYAYPDFGFGFFYGPGWGRQWNGYAHGVPAPHGGPPLGGAPHGGGGHGFR
jgi:hypothetical protein